MGYLLTAKEAQARVLGLYDVNHHISNKARLLSRTESMINEAIIERCEAVKIPSADCELKSIVDVRDLLMAKGYVVNLAYKDLSNFIVEWRDLD